METVYMENITSYLLMSFHMVSHVLTPGYAAMLAALLYFVLTLRLSSPKYRMSSILSVVVMVSAALLLYSQTTAWENAFVFNAETGLCDRAEGAILFTNGFRYLSLSMYPCFCSKSCLLLPSQANSFAATAISFSFQAPY